MSSSSSSQACASNCLSFGGSSIPCHCALVSQLHPQDPAGAGDSPVCPVCPVLQSPGCRDQLLGAAGSHQGCSWICSAGSLHNCWRCPSVIPADSSSWSQKLDLGSSLITSLPHEFSYCTSGTLPKPKSSQVQELPQQQQFEIKQKEFRHCLFLTSQR